MDHLILKLSNILSENLNNISQKTLRLNSSYEKSLCKELGLHLETDKVNLRYRDSFIEIDDQKHGIEIKKARDGMHFDCIRYAEMVKSNIVHENAITMILFYSERYDIVDIILIKTADLIFKLFENTPFGVLNFYVDQHKKDKNSTTFLRKLSKKELKALTRVEINKRGVFMDGTLLFVDNDKNITEGKNVECGLINIGKRGKVSRTVNIPNTFIFKNKRYHYNDGYSYSKSVWDEIFVSRIEYKRNLPVFIVENVSTGKKHFGHSPTAPWMHFCKFYNKKRGTKRAINGPLYFGLRDKNILNKLRFHQ